MFLPVVLVCLASLAEASSIASPVEKADLRTYEAAKAKAGSRAEAHVKLALWCEGRGFMAQRKEQLEEAVKLDPGNTAARGLLGQVSLDGAWEPPDAVASRIKADEQLGAKLAEYNARRDALDRLPRRRSRVSPAVEAKAHVALGMWCEKVGLKAAALAHFTSAVVLDPYRDASWKHLGYIKHGGRWMSHAQADAERREADAQYKANAYWEPKLRTWRTALRQAALTRDHAKERLDEINDPRAVPSLLRVFGNGSEAGQTIVVQILTRIEAPESTRQLASLAVFSESPTIREAAIHALKKREPRDYGGTLVEMLHTPIRYRVQPVAGPGSPGALLVETSRFKMMRTYDAPPAFRLGGGFYGYVGFDENGLPVVARGVEVDKIKKLREKNSSELAGEIAMIEERTQRMLAEANLKAAASQQQLILDVNGIEAWNAQANVVNSRVVDVLQGAMDAPKVPELVKPANAEMLAGNAFPDEGVNDSPKNDEDSWRAWWFDRLGYKYTPPPTITHVVNAAPQPSPPSVYSCFNAGTPVRTLEGLRRIETLRVGDQVLSQDISTGSLGFQPILVVHHNAPGETLRIRLEDGEILTASVYHRFWLAGKGWAMARELKAGDVLRTLKGPSRIESVEEGIVEPLFNLVVAQTRTFFVGNSDTLVHDNTLPEIRVKPFDAPPTLAAIGSERR
ncbi:polymorphic toxin-type HINT domain-containing protein [Singulisphaera rosea]